MMPDAVDLQTKLCVFQEFLDCADIALWHFDGEMRLLSEPTDSADIEALFEIGGGRRMICEYCAENDLPGFCADAATLLWLAVPRRMDGALTDVYVVGPVLGSAASERALCESLDKPQFPSGLVHQTSDILKRIPVVQHTLLIQYGVMLYRCLTGVRLEVADFQLIANSVKIKHTSASEEDDLFSREGTYAMERQIFQAVEDGNIHYRHPQESFSKRVGVMVQGDPVRQAKNQTIAAITLITRAAIRGGLSEEMAYALSDWYIQMMEATDDIAEVYQYSRDAFQDFTRRVHRRKLAQGRSREIQECVSYIEIHFQERITMDALAETLGYSKNYLSAKFAREVGMSISDYIAYVKIERAKLWLKNTDKSVQQISHELNYNAVSYFSVVFKKHTGVTPSEYRNL